MQFQIILTQVDSWDIPPPTVTDGLLESGVSSGPHFAPDGGLGEKMIGEMSKHADIQEHIDKKREKPWAESSRQPGPSGVKPQLTTVECRGKHR